jgi:small multidrug resistance family-3 protein
LKSITLFFLAGLLEIGGGYLVWIWLRGNKSAWLGVIGFVLLALYGILPTLQPTEHPFGRIYATYGAVFIVLSVAWGWIVDSQIPDLRDWVGIIFCLLGALIMMYPRMQSVGGGVD